MAQRSGPVPRVEEHPIMLYNWLPGVCNNSRPCAIIESHSYLYTSNVASLILLIYHLI